MNHGWTKHGYSCCVEAKVGDAPSARARCGGPHMCSKCALDVVQIHGDGQSELPTELERLKKIVEAARAYEQAWNRYANPSQYPDAGNEVARILAKAEAHQVLLDTVRENTDLEESAQ